MSTASPSLEHGVCCISYFENQLLYAFRRLSIRCLRAVHRGKAGLQLPGTMLVSHSVVPDHTCLIMFNQTQHLNVCRIVDMTV